jgi:hypothetical protein
MGRDKTQQQRIIGNSRAEEETRLQIIKVKDITAPQQ